MVKDRGKVLGMQEMNTRLFWRISILTVDFNTSLAVYLTNVPTLENFALILLFSVLVGTSFSRLVWCSERFTWLTVVTSTLVSRGSQL